MGAHRHGVDEDPTARWVALSQIVAHDRPDSLPSLEQFLRERRGAGKVLVEPCCPPRQRRRYRRLVRDYELSLAAWREAPDDEPGDRWRFVCQEAERRVGAEEHRAILSAQTTAPQLVLETLEGSRWWMYAGRFFVSHAELDAADVTARLAGRRPSPSPPPVTGSGPLDEVPAEVRRFVLKRDRGRCGACGDDGPDLRVDPESLRLVCGDCVADGWAPAPAGPAPPPPKPAGTAAKARPPRAGARPARPRSRRRRPHRRR